MDLGKLRHTVCLQQPIDSQDEFGKALSTWASVATVHAQVQSSAGSESVDNGQITAQLTHVVTVRCFPGLSPHWRVLWHGKILQILEVKTDATAKRWQILKCSEVVSGQSEAVCVGR
jgi:SPP1 family predicted phage head-tail adaptor